MPRGRRYELDELIIRPGTYFNPQTEVMIVVDDSPSMDSEIFNMEEFEGADWVLISDDLPVDESARDELHDRHGDSHRPERPRGQERVRVRIDEVLVRVTGGSQFEDLPDASHEKDQSEHSAREEDRPSAIPISSLVHRALVTPFRRRTSPSAARAGSFRPREPPQPETEAG